MSFSIKKLLEEKKEILKDIAYKQNWQMILLDAESPKVHVEKKLLLLSIRQFILQKSFIKVQFVSSNIFIQQSAI